MKEWGILEQKNLQNFLILLWYVSIFQQFLPFFLLIGLLLHVLFFNDLGRIPFYYKGVFIELQQFCIAFLSFWSVLQGRAWFFWWFALLRLDYWFGFSILQGFWLLFLLDKFHEHLIINNFVPIFFILHYYFFLIVSILWGFIFLIVISIQPIVEILLIHIKAHHSLIDLDSLFRQ